MKQENILANMSLTTPFLPLTASKNNEHILSFLGVISIVGIIGNLLVAIVYWRKKDKQTSTFFILVLALSDLAVCSILVPLTAYMEIILFDTKSRMLCKLYFFLTTTVVPNSSLIMSAIALDRYFCICMVNRVIMTLPRAKNLVLILFITSGLLGVIPALSSVVKIDYQQEQESYQSAPRINNNLSTATSPSSLDQLISSNFTQIPPHLTHVCTIDTNAEYTRFGALIWPFKLFYDLMYACSVLIITILYILIYKEIYIRRRIKRNRKQELLKNGCLVLAAATKISEPNARENNISRVIAIATSTIAQANFENNNNTNHGNGDTEKRFGVDGLNGLTKHNLNHSLKKCYCYFENNKSK